MGALLLMPLEAHAGFSNHPGMAAAAAWNTSSSRVVEERLILVYRRE